MISKKYDIPGRSGDCLACVSYLPEGQIKFQLVVAHGFRGAKENSGRLEPFAKQVVSRSGSVTAFDFAGSGESQGSFSDTSLSRQIQDMKAIIDHVLEAGNSPLILLGRSFGGTTALAAASEDERIKGLVLWSTPVLLKQTFFGNREHWDVVMSGGFLRMSDDKGEFSLGPGFAQDFANHDFDKYLKALGDRKVLVIHGAEDRDVSLSNVEYIQEQATGAVEIHIVPGADHRFSEHQADRVGITLDWLERHYVCRVDNGPDPGFG